MTRSGWLYGVWPGRAKLGYVKEERAIPISAERRSDAIMAFLGAGLVQRPSRAQAVDALAAARRGVASCQARGGAVSEWLADQVRRHGIGENAAVLAVLEIPDFRHQAAQGYVLEHPGRRQALEDLLADLS